MKELMEMLSSLKDSTKAKKVLIVLSGGQDSTTCLALAKELYEEVHCITFDYGQTHKKEITSAEIVTKIFDVQSHEILKIGNVLKGTSPLVSGEKLEEFQNWKKLPGGLEKTFVPGRNALFLTLAGNRAYCIDPQSGAVDIMTGVSQEDFGGYPDCREQFILAQEETINEMLGFDHYDKGKGLRIKTPLINLTKKQTVEFAMILHNCYYALQFSHTGYDGEYPPISKNHANLLRAKGFEQANIPDPLILRACNDELMPFPETLNYDKKLIEIYSKKLVEKEKKQDD